MFCCFFSFLFFKGILECQFCLEEGERKDIGFTSISGLQRHHKTHGPEIYPWVCGVCKIVTTQNAAFFRSVEAFVAHWKTHHPHVKTAKEVIHRDYGSHYRLFKWENFNDIPLMVGQKYMRPNRAKSKGSKESYRDNVSNHECDNDVNADEDDDDDDDHYSIAERDRRVLADDFDSDDTSENDEEQNENSELEPYTDLDTDEIIVTDMDIDEI